MHFDSVVFFHALYVGFAYSMLAFGATYYRQVVDDLDLQEVHLGEDMFIADMTPVIWLSVGSFFFVFCIFATIALLQSEGNIFLYVIPIACAINIAQLLLRAHHQRLLIKTQGIIVRHLLIEGNIPLAYDDVRRIYINEFVGWFIVHFYTDNEDVPAGACHLSTRNLSHIVRTFRQKNPQCSVHIDGSFAVATEQQ